MKRKIIVILTVIICFLLQSTRFKFLSFASISAKPSDHWSHLPLALCVEKKKEW